MKAYIAISEHPWSVPKGETVILTRHEGNNRYADVRDLRTGKLLEVSRWYRWEIISSGEINN